MHILNWTLACHLIPSYSLHPHSRQAMIMDEMKCIPEGDDYVCTASACGASRTDHSLLPPTCYRYCAEQCHHKSRASTSTCHFSMCGPRYNPTAGALTVSCQMSGRSDMKTALLCTFCRSHARARCSSPHNPLPLRLQASRFKSDGGGCELEQPARHQSPMGRCFTSVG